MRFKILVTEPEYFDKDSIRIMKSAGDVKESSATGGDLEEIIADFDAIVVRVETRLDKELLSRAKRLKVIGSATTGLNHIDTTYAKKHNIRVISLHGTHTISTAEHTFALILSLCRKIPWAYESLRSGIWERYKFIGTELNGKRIGIIGLGRIGSRVASYAEAFGMNVVYYDKYVNSNSYKKVSLKKLISSSDVISIHAELNDETKGLIGIREFERMKRGTVLIDDARAGIVDYSALLDALKRKLISGAALDVFTDEPLIKRTDPLIKYARKNKNLIITPHIGASTKEAVHEAGVEIATAVKEALKELK